MRDVPGNQILMGAALLLAALALGFAARGWYRRFRMRLRWARAQKIEQQAATLLADRGYQVLDSQVGATYELQVDGQPSTVSLRADYLVSRSGRRYVAEVKSGQLAPRIDTASTRRQLLEYWAAFQVDGVLLVDGESRRVREVTFPLPLRSSGPGKAAIYGFIVGLAVAAALAFWVFLSRTAFPDDHHDDARPPVGRKTKAHPS